MDQIEALILRQVNQRKKDFLERGTKKADEGWERLTKHFTQKVEIKSEISADGNSAYSQVTSKWLGVQNRGAVIPPRVPKRARALRFEVGGQGTLIRGTLESRPPKRGTRVIYTKRAKGFILKAGQWDLANKRAVLESLQDS